MSSIYPPRRQQKAMMLTAHIMHVLDKHLSPNVNKRELYREIEDLFYSTGAEVITEADRIQAGLMPRDHNGLTLEEIKILDARFAKAMIEPMQPIVFKD